MSATISRSQAAAVILFSYEDYLNEVEVNFSENIRDEEKYDNPDMEELKQVILNRYNKIIEGKETTLFPDYVELLKFKEAKDGKKFSLEDGFRRTFALQSLLSSGSIDLSKLKELGNVINTVTAGVYEDYTEAERIARKISHSSNFKPSMLEVADKLIPALNTALENKQYKNTSEFAEAVGKSSASISQYKELYEANLTEKERRLIEDGSLSINALRKNFLKMKDENGQKLSPADREEKIISSLKENGKVTLKENKPPKAPVEKDLNSLKAKKINPGILYFSLKKIKEEMNTEEIETIAKGIEIDADTKRVVLYEALVTILAATEGTEESKLAAYFNGETDSIVEEVKMESKQEVIEVESTNKEDRFSSLKKIVEEESVEDAEFTEIVEETELMISEEE